MTTIKDIETRGNKMTTALGFENKAVLLFWKAFEEKRFLVCDLYLELQGF